MMTRSRFVVGLVVGFLVLGLGQSAWAVINGWDGPLSGNQRWDVDGNWSQGHAPLITEDVYLNPNNSSKRILITDGIDAVAKNVFGPNINRNIGLFFDMDGGTLTVDNLISMGHDTNTGLGTWNLSDGTVTVGSLLRVGHRSAAVLNMSGGMVTLGTKLFVGNNVEGGTGQVNLRGGTIIANATDTPLPIQNNSNVDISGTGKLLLWGDVRTGIQGNLIATDKLTGNGLPDDDQLVMELVTYDNQTYTQITAVPEPATLGLLAVGGLLWRRRR